MAMGSASGKITLRPTVREVPADLETPVSAFLKLKSVGARFLLESVEQPHHLGRYSFIGVDALKLFKVLPEHFLVEEGGRTAIHALQGRNPLHFLRDELGRYELPSQTGLPNLVGGAVGYMGYDFVRFLERIPAPAGDDLGLPVGAFLLTGTFVIFDHVKRKMLLLSMAPEAEAKMGELQEVLKRPLPGEYLDPRPVARRAVFSGNFTEEQFCHAVLKLKEHIRMGDIFQGVLSQRMSGEVRVDPFQIYRALRILNPSPYMAYVDFGDYQLVGSSPEVHAKLIGREAVIRPIAGTRTRGRDDGEDHVLERELLGDEKERAEHLMLVDLARNDLGRVCEYGSVTCSQLFGIERYSHVMHLVSQVNGRLRDGMDQFDLLSSTFPAGTVTGAPKIRAMEILSEMEPVRRGPYAGTYGYFSLSGDMDMCITIRTLVLKGGTAYLQAGAGIVADSDPKREWQETVHKMEALKRAVEVAEEGL